MNGKEGSADVHGVQKKQLGYTFYLQLWVSGNNLLHDRGKLSINESRKRVRRL